MGLLRIDTVKKIMYPENMLIDISRLPMRFENLPLGCHFSNCEKNMNIMIESFFYLSKNEGFVLTARYAMHVDIDSVVCTLGISRETERRWRYSALRKIGMYMSEKKAKYTYNK